MTPLSLATFRDLSRRSPQRARLVWSDGLAVSFDAATCCAAVAGMAEADLSGYRFTLIADIGREAGRVQLPTPLLAAIRMEPGWTGLSSTSDADQPISRIGAALALVALGAARVGLAAGCGEVSFDPKGGVLVTRH